MIAKTKTSYKRGSEWRKWDLHVHSPASFNYKGDYPALVNQIGSADCAVIGINDYFSVAGYKELLRRLHQPSDSDGNKAYRDALERLRPKTLLPVVECRMTNMVLSKKAPSGTRFNFHIVFSNELDPNDIERFLMGLKVGDQSIGARRYSDPEFLFNEVAVDFSEVVAALNADATYKGKFLIWMPYDEYGGIDSIDPRTHKLFKDGLIRKADMLGSGNRKQADFFLWKDTKFSEEEYKLWFGKRKPCVKGSDSHNANDEVGRLKDQDSKPTERYCWIKADPTFDGLRQIINEPEDRIFIGAVPPKLALAKANKTRFLSRIQVRKTPGATTSDVWFDADLELNHDMVAIIGNKGSGKSAIADIVALAGDTAQSRHFSFLTKKKFREKKLAANFEVVASWADGTPSQRNLQDDPDASKPEAVKYISQLYLEHICTAVDEGSAFQSELRNVIFSHIGSTERLGKRSLDELIEYKAEEINQQIVLLRQQVAQTNTQLATLLEKAAPDHRKQLVEALTKKKLELDAHDKNKPAEVQKPEDLGEDAKKTQANVAADLAAHQTSITTLEAQIVQARSKQKAVAEHLSLAAKLENRLTNIAAEHTAHRQASADACKVLGVDFDALVALKIDRAPLATRKQELQAQKNLVDSQLNETASDSLVAQHKKISETIEGIKSQLDEPNRRYQAYLQALKSWQLSRIELEGSAEKPATVRYFEAQLAYVDAQLSIDIQEQRNSRKTLSEGIYSRTMDLRNLYAELFAPVQQLIENTAIIKEGFRLTFASGIVRKGFRRRFFDQHISQAVNGSFCGKEPGEQRLDELLDNFDFNKPGDAIRFAEAIEDHLMHDYRNAKKPSMDIAAQLRKHATIKGLYDFLWSFEYLVPEYSLKLDGKDLTQLSPGERGALLLVFYLLVDKSELPIIVDQPEENLDNQTVYRLLIPVIKDAKRKRQIIMVTHNPNIAVVCDAEQIVHASFDRAQGNQVTYVSGSIENRTINKRIVDVLEGTRPAFDNRDDKYYPN